MNICATCKHLKSEPKEVNKVGLFRCHLLPVWTYKAANGHCDKWMQTQDADKRVEWMKTKGWL